MGQRKAPSPLSAPIAAVRATGATVRYGEAHNPRHGYPHAVVEVIVTEPGLSPLRITRPGSRHAEVVDRLHRIAERRRRQGNVGTTLSTLEALEDAAVGTVGFDAQGDYTVKAPGGHWETDCRDGGYVDRDSAEITGDLQGDPFDPPFLTNVRYPN